MKKNMLKLLCLFLSLTACQSGFNPVVVEKQKLSDKTAEWDIEVSFPQFSSKNTEINESCDVINKEIRRVVAEWQDDLKKGAEEFVASMGNDTLGRPDWIYQLLVTDSVFIATGRYISVRLMNYTFTGGAHGMTHFHAFNYDVEHRTFLSKEDIFDYMNKDEVNARLKKHFDNPEGCFSETPTLNLASTVTFSPLDVCFTYDHYVLGAYACGSYEQTVPRMELKKALKIK